VTDGLAPRAQANLWRATAIVCCADNTRAGAARRRAADHVAGNAAVAGILIGSGIEAERRPG